MKMDRATRKDLERLEAWKNSMDPSHIIVRVKRTEILPFHDFVAVDLGTPDDIKKVIAAELNFRIEMAEKKKAEMEQTQEEGEE